MSSPDRVLGHYEVGAQMGAGGMGRVYRGTDLRDGTAVAIKFLNASLVDASFRERFEREAHVAALLPSPYTVHLLDYDEAVPWPIAALTPPFPTGRAGQSGLALLR